MKNFISIIILLVGVYTSTAQINVGDAMPTIILSTDKEENFSLSSSTGKVTLVDIWASWCGPCRIANKKLVRLYNETRDKNFEIVGISLDTDRKKWLAAIAKDQLHYMQLIDQKGFDANTAIVFNVEQLPATYLFDVTGKLVAINPTEQQILNEIN